MTRRTSGWTDLAAVAGIGIMTAVGLAYAAAATGAVHPALVLGAAGVVAMLSTSTDALGGIVVALFAGAAVTGAQLALFGIPDRGAAAWAVMFALLLVLGALGGVIGDRVRRERRRVERAHSIAVVPAAGSIGLLGAADGGLRLAEEVTRARLFERPLSAAKVTVDITDDGISRGDARRARRAVARALENVLRETDIPYALDDGGFGVVLPETAPDAAADVVGSVLIAAAQASFTDRANGQRRRVGEVVSLRLGIVDASAAAFAAPSDVLDAAGAAMRHFDPALEGVAG